MDELDYHHLKYFWAVALSETLTKATGRVGLAPQTLSTQIEDLESSLGQDPQLSQRLVPRRARKISTRTHV